MALILDTFLFLKYLRFLESLKYPFMVSEQLDAILEIIGNLRKDIH